MVSLELYQKTSVILTIIIAQSFLCTVSAEQNQSKNEISIENLHHSIKPTPEASFPSGVDKMVISNNNNNKAPLEPRMNNFVKDIVDRLHALDADIGKLLFNSSSMYSPNDQAINSQLGSGNASGGQKFTEILDDLDSLQDEIGRMVSNATRTRQYNILVRLRPLNTILYRIRHNLHLMRNSLVAINTVSSLEKLGNSVLDSTLTAFMRPDADLNEEIGDNGNYDINLDKISDNSATSATTQQPPSSPVLDKKLSSSAPLIAIVSTTPSTTTTTTTTTPSTTTTTTTTTTPKPPTSITVAQNLTVTEKPPRRTTRRPANNRTRTNNRNQRRTTTTTTTLKPVILIE